jgi:hypothetical protein
MGRKKGTHLKYDPDAVQEAMAKLRCHQQRTLCALSWALSISKTTIIRVYKEEGVIRRCNNQLKPALTETNKLTRFLYAWDKINGVSDTGCMTFDNALLNVHVDKKWFFLTEKDQTIYLAQDEEPPERSVKNKSHITKVMFLTAVACPQFNEDGNCTFDGKVGMWPFVTYQPAATTSTNRVRGTIITKPTNVTYRVYLEYMLQKVLPAIKQKFPRNHAPSIHIGIQHDNAPSHFKGDDPGWQAATNQEMVWRFYLKEQPTNLPDTNVLDLGFFASIQALQWAQEPAITVDGLIASVMA